MTGWTDRGFAGHGSLPTEAQRRKRKPLPEDADAVRREVSGPRWRVYEAIRRILDELDETLDWEILYDANAPLREFLSWGLFLEELIPQAAGRIRAALEAEPAAGEVAEADPEELEDAVFWGTRQIEGGMQQVASILSRHMVELITTGAAEAAAVDLDRNQALCVPIADVGGKLRSDLRRFASFVVAGDAWDSSRLELVLFPQKMDELRKGQRLKSSLVHTMESFQGGDDRLPIGEVVRLWRTGRVLGPAALYEIDILVRGLEEVLQRENRRALYADSYYRLAKWIGHVKTCVEGLKQNLGDDAMEARLLREIAAVLDTDILAEMIGGDSLREASASGDWQALGRLVHKSELKKLELDKASARRLLEIKERLESGDDAPLDASEQSLLVSAAGCLKGKRLVDQLRIRGRLPESMSELAPIHPLVLDSEDGLKTYLMLLYGQIQNRDLHLLEADQKDVSMAEKRLAVLELEYQLARLESSERYAAFEAARAMVGARRQLPDDIWDGLRSFLRYLAGELAPRLRRIGSFAEIEGIPPDCGTDLITACQPLFEMEQPPGIEQYDLLDGLFHAMVSTLLELRDIRIVVAPPQTVAEIEDFLNTMG